MKGIFTYTIQHALQRRSETASAAQGISGFFHRLMYHLLWDLIPTLLILASVSWISLKATAQMNIADPGRSVASETLDPPHNPG
jgi:hypothetical protein